MTRPRIEPWSPGPLANTLLIRPMASVISYFCYIQVMKEWRNDTSVTHSIQKYITRFISRKGSKLVASLKHWQGNEGRRHRLAKDCYIDLFLNLSCNSIFRALCFCSHDERFSTEFYWWPLGLHPFLALTSCSLNLLTAWLRLCIYNFITPKVLVVNPCDLLLAVNPRELSSCLHCWNILS